MYSCRLPAIIICPPYLDHVDISSANSRRKACIGQFLLNVLLNKFKCCAYTDPITLHWFGGIDLYNVTMQRVEFSWPLNHCHDHLPNPVVSLIEPISLPDRLPVANDLVTLN